MKAVFSDLWALAYLMYKKEQKGEKVTYESISERFGKKTADACLSQTSYCKKSLFVKNGNYYTTTEIFKAAFQKMKPFL